MKMTVNERVRLYIPLVVSNLAVLCLVHGSKMCAVGDGEENGKGECLDVMIVIMKCYTKLCNRERLEEEQKQ